MIECSFDDCADDGKWLRSPLFRKFTTKARHEGFGNKHLIHTVVDVTKKDRENHDQSFIFSAARKSQQVALFHHLTCAMFDSGNSGLLDWMDMLEQYTTNFGVIVYDFNTRCGLSGGINRTIFKITSTGPPENRPQGKIGSPAVRAKCEAKCAERRRRAEGIKEEKEITVMKKTGACIPNTIGSVCPLAPRPTAVTPVDGSIVAVNAPASTISPTSFYTDIRTKHSNRDSIHNHDSSHLYHHDGHSSVRESIPSELHRLNAPLIDSIDDPMDVRVSEHHYSIREPMDSLPGYNSNVNSIKTSVRHHDDHHHHDYDHNRPTLSHFGNPLHRVDIKQSDAYHKDTEHKVLYPKGYRWEEVLC